VNPLPLRQSTGYPNIDTLLRTLVTSFELAFPNRVSGYYLIGSYAEGTAVPLSDLDCFILFKNDFESPTEQQHAQSVSQEYARTSPIRLDVILSSEATYHTLHSVLKVALKLGSLLVYGEDKRAIFPLPPQSTYTQELIQGARRFIGLLRDQGQLVQSRVEYPDPNDEFYGYTHVHLQEWYPPGLKASTKELVATASRIAAAQVALQAHEYVPGKLSAIQLYREQVGGRWASFLEDLFELCKRQWQYLIPAGGSERAQLRQLCEQMLEFENTFLQATNKPIEVE